MKKNIKLFALVLAFALLSSLCLSSVAIYHVNIPWTNLEAYADITGSGTAVPVMGHFRHEQGTAQYFHCNEVIGWYFRAYRDSNYSSEYRTYVEEALDGTGMDAYRDFYPEGEWIDVPASDPSGICYLWYEVEGSSGIWGVSEIGGAAVESGTIEFAPTSNNIELHAAIYLD